MKHYCQFCSEPYDVVLNKMIKCVKCKAEYVYTKYHQTTDKEGKPILVWEATIKVFNN
jgi:hypothetical protein